MRFRNRDEEAGDVDPNPWTRGLQEMRVYMDRKFPPTERTQSAHEELIEGNHGRDTD